MGIFGFIFSGVFCFVFMEGVSFVFWGYLIGFSFPRPDKWDRVALGRMVGLMWLDRALLGSKIGMLV